MTTNSKPSRIIKIDKHTDKIVLPTILLQTRSFKTIGKLNYTNFNASLVANGIDEISFEIHKYVDGRICPIWDDIEDLKLVKVEDYGRFQIRVSYTDSTETVKAIHGQSLEVELGQLMLNNFHVNDDEATDMVYTDYSKDNYDKVDDNNYVFVPTVFYNDKDPKRSLLHRVLADKAPHWKIGHVPTWVSMSEDDVAELANTFKRMYTVDGTSIYDFLTGEVAKETNVIFVFDTLGEERIINCYSLIDCYDESGKLVEHAYGNDTNIFVSKKNLASEISIESNQDELKNCFRVEGGDDLITASVAAVNMNGTNYIWCFSDLQLRDMSEELRNKIKDYQTIMSSQETKDLYYGENGIYTRLTNAYEELYQKESSLMPTITAIDPGDAKTQYEKVVDALQTSTVYVTSLNNYSADSHVGLDSMVVEYASVFMDSRFEIEVINDKDSNKSQFDKNAKLWKGKFKITQRTDSSNTYPTIVDDFEYIKVDIEDKSTENGELEFVRQKTLKALAESDMQNFDFTNIDEDEARSYFEKFALNRLTSFYDAYDRCLSIMGDFGIVKDEEDERRKLYNEYYKILTIIGEVKKVREQEVADIKVKIGNIEAEQKEFQNSEQYNFEKFLGEELYSEFCLYRREDTYSNSNYISDNLNTTTEQLEKAQELLKVAETELKKACVLQRTVSASLNNLLALPEFEPLYEDFALYNFIRIKTDDEIIKLRLIKIEFDGDSVESINVTFSEQIESVDKNLSDLESVLQQASSIATSYSSTVKQAKQGSSANNQITDMVTNGLVAAKTSLATDIHNEVEITGAGIIARRMDDEGSYGNKQLKISGNRMYFTDDAWQSVSMAIGEVNFNGEDRYGVLADVICGNLIAGKQMMIGNEDGSVQITGDGIDIYNKLKEKIFYADNEGNLNLTGIIKSQGGDIGGWTITENALLKKDKNGDLIRLDSNAKSIVSIKGENKAVITSGYIGFEKDNTKYTTLNTTYWGTQPTVYGVGINSEYASKFISFGNKKTEDADSYATPFLLNYGLNPNKNDNFPEHGTTDKDVLIYGSTWHSRNIYFYNDSFIGESSDEYKGLFASNAIHTPRVFAGNYVHGDYALDVNGKSYFSNDIRFKSRILCGDSENNGLWYTSDDHSLYSIGKFGVGGVPYTNYILGVHGDVYIDGQLKTTSYITSMASGYDSSGKPNESRIIASNVSQSGRLTSTAGENFGVFSDTYNTWLIRIKNDGTVVCNDSNSDSRLKNSIEDTKVDDALEQILSIKHKEFYFNKNNKFQDNGYIAQQLEEINPNLVLPPDNEEKYYSVNTFYMESLITKAIQEFYEKYKNETDEFKQEIKELKKKYKS